jgi:hypothetical protein
MTTEPNLEGCMADPEQWPKVPVVIETDAATLLAVHGFLALALRHPEAGLRPSAELVAAFCRRSIELMVNRGLFTEKGKQLLAHDLYTNDRRCLPDSLRELVEAKNGAA